MISAAGRKNQALLGSNGVKGRVTVIDTVQQIHMYVYYNSYMIAFRPVCVCALYLFSI